MSFDYTQEQRLLLESVERYGAVHYPVTKRQERVREPDQSRRHRWREIGALGWLALPLSEEQGGAGADLRWVAALMEGFGRHLVLEPYATGCVFASKILDKGEALAGRILAEVAAGSTIVAPALIEQQGGPELSYCAVSAARSASGGFRLRGVKAHCANAAHADWLIVPARTSGRISDRNGISLFAVPTAHEGVQLSPYRSADGFQHATVAFDDVALSEGHLVGGIDAGVEILEPAVDATICSVLAEAVGIMDMLSERTIAYLKTREQFGAPISRFQVLQHRVVDMMIANEEARSILFHALASFEDSRDDRRRAVSAAKARIGQLGVLVAQQAIQLHGGVGVTDELIIGHGLKRLMMIDASFGSSEHHKAYFAGLG